MCHLLTKSYILQTSFIPSKEENVCRGHFLMRKSDYAAQMIIHCKSFLGPWVVNILFAPDLDLYQYQLFVTKGRAPPKYSWKASDDIVCRNIIVILALSFLRVWKRVSKFRDRGSFPVWFQGLSCVTIK